MVTLIQRRRVAIFFCFFSEIVFFDGVTLATSKATVESVAIGNVTSAAQLFETLNGYFPTNWSQINEILDLNVINQQSLIKSPACPLQEHYVFVTDKIPVPGYKMGEVVLIRTGAVKYDGGAGRYLISRYDSVVNYTWLAEEKIQKMLADAGVTKLPDPDPVEAAAAKAAVEAFIAKERWEHEMIVAAAPKPTWADLRAAWWDRIKSWFVTPSTGIASGGQVRVVPVVLSGMFLLSLGALGWRWCCKKK